MEAMRSNIGLTTKAVRTDIPARLDRLPWSRWHWLVVVSLGITWILDGLEVTIVGSIAAVLTDRHTLHLSDVQVSAAAKVARFAEVPVPVLREGGPVPEARHPGEPPLRILVPLDGSDAANAALVPGAYLAATLARSGQGALHLLHVVQPDREAKVPTRTARSAQNTQADQNMAREYLDATIRHLRENPDTAHLNLVLTSSVTVDDDIAQGIVRVAENGVDDEGDELFDGCDAIAMTTHGHSGRQRWVGSVTERVLETTRLPLLTVRPGE